MRKFIFVLIIFMFAVSVCLNIGMYRHLKTDIVKSDTVYKEKVIKVKDTAPGIKDEKTVGHATFPVHSNSSNTGKNHVKETGKSIHDTANIAKKDENLNMTLDIVQRKYTDDSTYTAYVSGAKIDSFPRLDSILVRQKTIERTIINTIYKDKHGLRFKIRPAAGGGYDPINKQLGVYVGGAVVLDW